MTSKSLHCTAKRRGPAAAVPCSAVHIPDLLPSPQKTTEPSTAFTLQGTEHHHEPVPIHLLPHSTVADLKRRIERTNLHGQSVRMFGLLCHSI